MGPTVRRVLGDQASSVLVSASGVLIPLSALLLVGSLVLVGRRVTPAGAAAGA
ncbi:hypothetical protein [Halomarina rubra]|uniref:Uncharacterized protein n=1 Tax=Halomarina rubra TaxID=2071873 RepID=A0ABD6AZJ5_9EURY|nr:hypothetical protein [Halomarina rubra]